MIPAADKARRRRPRARKWRAIAAPAASLENPTTVSTGSGQVPGLDDRYGKPQQHVAQRIAHHADHDQRLGLPSDEGADQAAFAFVGIAEIAQQEVQAGGRHGVGQALHRGGEDRIVDGRDQQAHDAAAPRGEAAGGEVRNVAQRRDRRRHPRPRGRRHLVRRTQDPRHGDGGGPGPGGHIFDSGSGHAVWAWVKDA